MTPRHHARCGVPSDNSVDPLLASAPDVLPFDLAAR
jgi:hypothetical protein